MNIRHARHAMLALTAVGLQACATKGFVREEVHAATLASRVEIAAARDSAMRGANEAQMAANRDLETRMQANINSQITALRADLTSLRNDFNTRISVMQDSMKFLMPLQFGFDDATIRPEDQPVLQRFAQIANKYYPGSRVTVEGFADPSGSASYNIRLSTRRAEAVRSALVGFGMAESNLNAVGYGEARLVNKSAWRDAPGAEMNRRVVFAIETRGSPLSVTAMGSENR